MSFTITHAMVEQYSRNVLLLSQQMPARLREACQVEMVTGKSWFGERIGAVNMQERTSRHADTPLISTPHSKRKGTIHDYEWADLIDKQDTEKTLIDIQGKYVINAVAAANRQLDDVVIAALGGAAYSGESGGSPTTVNNYDAGECRLVAGDGSLVTAGSNFSDTTATNLTIAKLLLCKQLLDSAEVDPARARYFVCNAANIAMLLNTTEVKSADYNTVKALAQGKIDTFMGFKFIQSERLAADGTETDCNNSYAFAAGAISLGIGGDVRTSIDKRSDKSNAMQVLCELDCGATRVEGPAVVEINLKTAFTVS